MVDSLELSRMIKDYTRKVGHGPSGPEVYELAQALQVLESLHKEDEEE